MAKIVTFGEIMLRLATPDHLRFGQGNELVAMQRVEKLEEEAEA